MSIREYFSIDISYHIRPMNKDFNAIKFKDVLYPFKDGEKEVFIYGKGWVKVGTKTKHIKIPYLNDSSNILEYIKTYGYRCLYFGISSRDINPNDCSTTNILNDLMAFSKHGEKWVEFVTRIRALQNIVSEYYLKNHSIELNSQYKLQWIDLNNERRLVDSSDLFQVKVNHYIFYPFMAEKPTLCPINDDLKLIKTYNILRGINVKNDFPVSVEHRLTYFFGAEFAKEYKTLMLFFTK